MKKDPHVGSPPSVENGFFVRGKRDFVNSVFNRVAKKYDLMNDIMSFGIHRCWKNTMLNMVKPNSFMSLVDIGGGTGDIASRFLNLGGKNVKIVDINHNMLTHGKARHSKKIYKDKIDWITGDAERLPLMSNSVDVCTASFCIRNVESIETALTEVHRILKPGGRFLCLEFSKIHLPVLGKIYDAYSFSLLPYLGEVIAKDREAYQYLVNSIRKFPDQQQYSNLIRGVGFDQVKYRNLSGGIVAIHSAWRI